MKLLLDENLPRKLKRDLAEHEVFTVRDLHWDGKENGELLALMLVNGFEALVSGDKNIPFQQNFQKYPIPVIVLDAPDNTYDTIRLFAPKIHAAVRAGLARTNCDQIRCLAGAPSPARRRDSLPARWREVHHGMESRASDGKGVVSCTISQTRSSEPAARRFLNTGYCHFPAYTRFGTASSNSLV